MAREIDSKSWVQLHWSWCAPYVGVGACVEFLAPVHTVQERLSGQAEVPSADVQVPVYLLLQKPRSYYNSESLAPTITVKALLLL